MTLARVTGLLALLAACSRGSAPAPAPQQLSDAMLLGSFEDDYGSHFVITPTEWLQQPRSRYHIVRWRRDAMYLIAQNDAANPSDGGRWTRIDWIVLEGMPPYAWGFCLSAYAAPSAAAAESTHVVRRETPRTGCNGFPFSRMKPR